jgi:hypothetical protein
VFKYYKKEMYFPKKIKKLPTTRQGVKTTFFEQLRLFLVKTRQTATAATVRVIANPLLKCATHYRRHY